MTRDHRDACDPVACATEEIALHPCPFDMDVWNDFEDKCNCCPHAERQCAEDI